MYRLSSMSRDHRGTRSCEVIKLTQEAQDEMAALDHVLALHAELQEQENVLSMVMVQRDEAMVAQRAQQDEMSALRAEEAQLQENMLRARRLRSVVTYSWH